MYVVSLFLATFFVWFLREGEFWGETGWVGGWVGGGRT